MRNPPKGATPILRSRPQYHYFYGSTDASTNETPESSVASTDADPLLGESLVPTDNEEDTPNSSTQDLRQLVVTTTTGHRHIKQSYQPGTPSPYPDERNFSRSPRPKSIWMICGEKCLYLNASGPVGHVTRILMMMASAICICTMTIVVLHNAPSRTEKERIVSLLIPFPIVDRANLNDPAATIVDLSLFDSSLLFQAGQSESKGYLKRFKTGVDPILRVPFPTGAFWTNLVLSPDDDGLSFPIVSYPYAFKWSDSLLQVSYPASRHEVDNSSLRDIFQPDIVFGTSEAIARRHIMKFDQLSVTLRYFANTAGFWETFIVHGTPYITIKYSEVKPVLKTLSTFLKIICPFDSDGNYHDGDATNVETRRLKWDVCTDSSSSIQKTTLYGVQFLLQTQEDLTWILFASEPIALTFDNKEKTSISSVEKFTGILRLALIPPTPIGPLPSKNTALLPISESTGFKRLVYHAGLYPIGGSVSWSFHASGSSSSTATSSSTTRRSATVQFQFQTALMVGAGSTQVGTTENQLLMLGLPHHADLVSSDIILSSKTFDLQYRCIKGLMSPIVGTVWSYDEALTTTGFDTAAISEKHPDVQNIILDSVKKDLAVVSSPPAVDIYGYLKQLARLAQLAHIASVTIFPKWQSTNQTQILDCHLDTLADATDKLHSSIRRIFDDEITDGLLYDAKFGGIVSKNGLSDERADYGNGRYNDHHFHYGYLLYACAVMGSLNSTFISQYGPFVDNILFDVASHWNGDSSSMEGLFFPLARHKSWYDGHSFSSGLFSSANGKSQVSSSEAVNCYYAAYLWSSVRNSNILADSADLMDFARLLLATEIRGAKKYWHMTPSKVVPNRTSLFDPALYDDSFARNYMVGTLGMLDAFASTWFGANPLYVHMINFLPVTAITYELFDKEYVEEQYGSVIEPLNASILAGWKGYTVCDHAFVDPYSAWQDAQSLVNAEVDSGLSKSQVLYWISSYTGFKYVVSSDDDDNDTAALETSMLSSSCEDNAECAILGLTGFCCPTSGGFILGCCDASASDGFRVTVVPIHRIVI